MNSNIWGGLVLATALWALVAATALSGPFSPRSELWVATSSQRVKSHPTLVRAAHPKLAAHFRAKIAAAE
jgi:cytochrome b